MRATSLLAFAALFALAGRAAAVPPDVSLPVTDVLAGPWKPIGMAPDGSWIAFTAVGGIGDPEPVADAGRVQVWNLKDGTLDRTFAVPGIGRTDQPPVISPDGRWLAYTRHIDYKAEIRVYDFRTGKRVRVIRDTDSEPLVIGFSADSKEVFTSNYFGNGGKKLVAWSVADGTKAREIALPKHERVTISPDGKTAVVELRRGDSQELWDTATGKKIANLGRDTAWRQATFLRGGKEVAFIPTHFSSGADYCVWEVGAEKKSATVKLPGKVKDPIRYALSDDRSATAALEYYGDLRVYDAGKAEPRFTFSLKAPLCEGPIFTPDGKRIIAIVPFERVWVLDAATGKPVFTLDPDYRSIKALAFTADGKSLVAGTAQWPKVNSSGTLHANDGFLLTWDTATGELKRAAGRIDNRPEAVFPSPDGEKAVVIGGHNAGIAEWWDLKAGKRLKVLAGGEDDVYYYGASADGKKFAGVHYEYVKTAGGGRGGNPSNVWVWDITTGERLKDLAVKSTTPVRFTPDGKSLLAFNHTDGAQIVPSGGGKPVALWKGVSGIAGFLWPEQPAPLPGGESFVMYHTPQQYAKRDLYVCDIGRQIQFGTTDVHVGPLAVSPDGKWVACGGIERDKANPVYLWKLPELAPLNEKELEPGKIKTGAHLAKRIQLDGHMGEVFAVAFSPDGKTLATGGRDKIIRLWDVQTGKLKASLWSAPPTDREGVPTEWAAFTPDGFHAGTARGRAFLRFAEGDGAKLYSPEKVREALKGQR